MSHYFCLALLVFSEARFKSSSTQSSFLLLRPSSIQEISCRISLSILAALIDPFMPFTAIFFFSADLAGVCDHIRIILKNIKRSKCKKCKK